MIKSYFPSLWMFQLGKHHCATFLLLMKKVYFGLIHCDVGIQKYQNAFFDFVISVFLDDYSWVSWVFLQKDGSQVISIILNIYFSDYDLFFIIIKFFKWLMPRC